MIRSGVPGRPPRDRIRLYEIMVLIAGLAYGFWLTPGVAGQPMNNGAEWFVVACFPLGGLSIAGVPLLLAERWGRSRRPSRFGAGRMAWFVFGLFALLLWPPVTYLKFVRPGQAAHAMTFTCFAYAPPISSLVMLVAFAAGGWLGHRGRMPLAARSWRERFGLGLTLAWGVLGMYVLGMFYLNDFRQ